MTDAAGDLVKVMPCDHCKFGLIVTGAGEREFASDLVRSLAQHAGCSFTVLRKIGQRSAVKDARRLKMVGRGTLIAKKDEVEIGLPARQFLRNRPCHFVLLLDDVEFARRDDLPAIFRRYREALDAMLGPQEQRRVAVHFFANMLEAYYFADSNAVNAAIGDTVLFADYEGDVEEIRHPKGRLKDLAQACNISFDERHDGAKIVPLLDLDHVLSRPETCEFLRSLFAWCVRQLEANCLVWDEVLGTRYQIPSGIQANLTRGQ